MEKFGNQTWHKFAPDVRILLFCSFLIPFGSFMVLPFIPIFMSQYGGMQMSFIGWILAVMSFIQFGGGLVGGVVANTIGYKKAMLLALTVRTIGFVLLCISTFMIKLAIPAVLLIATGAALYLPANKAYIVSSVSAEKKAFFLSLSNSTLNAGMGIGPLIGGIAILGHATILFVFVTILFFAVTILHIYFLSPRTQLESSLTGVRLSFSVCRLLLLPLSLNVLVFYIYFFFQNYMGPYTTQYHPTWMYSIILVLNSAIVIIFQPIFANTVKKNRLGLTMAICFALIAAGMYGISLHTTIGLLIGTCFISLAEIGLFLKIELTIVELLPDSPALGFGMQRLASGIGAAGSAIIGGFLFDISQQRGHLDELWLWAAFQALLIAVCCLFLANRTTS